MANNPFKFKDFIVEQDRCAMKIGTDGVLFGAWVDIAEHVNSILDIGTGTGLIALQLAQRSDAELIDALEIEPQAYEQAVDNFENSPWADRLFCYHASFQHFSSEIDEKYDLVVSNPPYYTDTFKELDEKRALARHSKSLSFDELLAGITKILSDKGTAAFIIPFKEEKVFLELALKNGLHPQKISRYRGNKKSELKRSMIQLTFEKSKLMIDEFFLEHSRHNYSDEYKRIVQDFYIKL